MARAKSRRSRRKRRRGGLSLSGLGYDRSSHLYYVDKYSLSAKRVSKQALVAITDRHDCFYSLERAKDAIETLARAEEHATSSTKPTRVARAGNKLRKEAKQNIANWQRTFAKRCKVERK